MAESIWNAPDDAASEFDMHKLLYALVRMVKPVLVVETGTYKGHGAQALARGCHENGFGRVITCDTETLRDLEASWRCASLPVEFRHCRGIDLPELPTADFVFCDSDYASRPAEIAACRRGAVIVVHDTRISYDSSCPPLEGLVHELGGISFDSHRGWGIIRKR
jgi:predicted O-methyltransferase YrrM